MAPAGASTGPVRPPSSVLARLPNNHGLNYPYAEAVLINCRLKGIPPVGWGPIDDETSHIHFWEFHSIDADGHLIDVRERHAVSKQLTEPQDAQTIANYSDPAFVLGGWTPVVDE
jgi:pectinesterase